MGCCDCQEKEKEVFVGARQRYCTDVAFLILWIVAIGLDIALAAVSIGKDPSLVDDIFYPTDSYGNNCGKPDTRVADMPKVFYPRLDEDIQEQADVLASYRYWDFNPTRLCAPECPSGFNLAAPTQYGGPTYPCGYDETELSSGDYANLSFSEPGSGENCVAGSVPSWYYIFVTQDIVSRCFPFDDSAAVGSRKICASPACTATLASGASLNASLDGSVHCASVEAYPDVTTAWEVCAAGTAAAQGSDLCTRQEAACDLVVSEDRTDKFRPVTETTQSTEYTEKLANYMKTVVGGVNGLLRSEAMIAQLLCGLLLPVLLAFVWALFLWFFAGVLIYLLIVLLVVVSLVGSFFCMHKAGWFGDSLNLTTVYNTTLTQQADDSEKTWYAALAVVFGVLTFLEILFFWLSKKAIDRLIAIVQECTKVFKALASIVLWPVFVQLPIEMGVFAYGCFIAYYISIVWTETSTLVTLMLLHLLFILWTLQVIKATVWASMSAAVGLWFTQINAPGSKEHGVGGCSFGCGELCASTGLILAKHVGSMAFGSLIIGICQLIRLVLTAIDYYTQDLQDKNIMLKVVMKCAQCVMFCLQKTIEFISYFGFIFVATQGQSFCKACVSTFAFVAKYTTQTAVNKTVQFLLRMLIGWSIPLFCAVLTFLVLDGNAAYSEYNAMWPALIVFIASYIIADGVCTVYDCCIDTIYLLSFEDMEREGGPKYMSEDLRKGFGIDEADSEASDAAKKYRSVSRRKKEGKGEDGGVALTGGTTSMA